jgi:hypothetical protein
MKEQEELEEDIMQGSPKSRKGWKLMRKIYQAQASYDTSLHFQQQPDRGTGRGKKPDRGEKRGRRH